MTVFYRIEKMLEKSANTPSSMHTALDMPKTDFPIAKTDFPIAWGCVTKFDTPPCTV